MAVNRAVDGQGKAVSHVGISPVFASTLHATKASEYEHVTGWWFVCVRVDWWMGKCVCVCVCVCVGGEVCADGAQGTCRLASALEHG